MDSTISKKSNKPKKQKAFKFNVVNDVTKIPSDDKPNNPQNREKENKNGTTKKTDNQAVFKTEAKKNYLPIRSKINRLLKVKVANMTSRQFQLDPKAHINDIDHYLKDCDRMKFFKESILMNRHLFRGRVVLEVTSHIGILSLFAAKAGAAKVYIVDCSNVLDYTLQIIKDNGYSDVIGVIKGFIDQVELPVNKVDVIISDWMGYSLLHNSAADAVLYARDKWLQPDGIIFPDMATLTITGMENNNGKTERVEWWNKVYDFNMKALRPWVVSESFLEHIKQKMVLTTDCAVVTFNMYEAKRSDLEFIKHFEIETLRAGTLDGIFTHFSVEFSKSHLPQGLYTSPSHPPTYFLQTAFYFDEPITVAEKQHFIGEFKMFTADNQNDFSNMGVSLCMSSFIQREVLFSKIMTHWNMKSNCIISHTIPLTEFSTLNSSFQLKRTTLIKAEKEKQEGKEKVKENKEERANGTNAEHIRFTKIFNSIKNDSIRGRVRIRQPQRNVHERDF